MTGTCFGRLIPLVQAHLGVVLRANQLPSVRLKLLPRLRALGLDGFDAYVRLLAGRSAGGELAHLASCLTINKTAFFREPRHFEVLKDELAAMRSSEHRSADAPCRIWSAACSTGEEPYSIAMCVADAFGAGAARILGTDVSPRVLSVAARGVYGADAVAEVPSSLREQYLTPRPTDDGGQYEVSSELRRMTVFRPLNLIYDDFAFRTRVDVIFCRNVLIYFDEHGVRKVIEKFRKVLSPDGLLFTGHSESLLRFSDAFRFVTDTVYRVVATTEDA